MYCLRATIVVLLQCLQLLLWCGKLCVYQSFVLIGCCVSELHDNLCPYRNVYSLRLFIVLQELHCLPNMPIPWSLWISISTQSFLSQLCLVIEIH